MWAGFLLFLLFAKTRILDFGKVRSNREDVLRLYRFYALIYGKTNVETMNGVGQYVGETSNQRYGELLYSDIFRMEDGKFVSVLKERVTDVTVTRISGTFSYFE